MHREQASRSLYNFVDNNPGLVAMPLLWLVVLPQPRELSLSQSTEQDDSRATHNLSRAQEA